MMNKLIIVLDAGHGGSDSGAVGNGLKEKDLTLALALKTRDILKAKGYNVVLTRDKDIYVGLNSKRTPQCDISVSIHINAGGGQGLEVWHALYNKAEKSSKLAGMVLSSILRHVPFKNRGLKTKKSTHGNYDYFFMLRCPKGIPILVECGFIDNKADAEILKKQLDKIAEGISEGIITFIKTYMQ